MHGGIVTAGVILLVIGIIGLFLKMLLWLAGVLIVLGIIGAIWGFVAREAKAM